MNIVRFRCSFLKSDASLFAPQRHGGVDGSRCRRIGSLGEIRATSEMRMMYYSVNDTGVLGKRKSLPLSYRRLKSGEGH